MRVCSATLTKLPLRKYTPSVILTALPVEVAFDGIALAKPSFAEITVVEYVREERVSKVSPSLKTWPAKSLDDFSY